MLIGLCGYARSGKDTVASMMPGFLHHSFAAKLKEEVATMLNSVGIEANFNNEDTKVALRPFLVFWGAFKRKEIPLYWVNGMQTHLTPHEDHVITDVRYLNEAQWIKEHNGEVWYIDRPGIGPANDEEAKSFAEIFRECAVGHNIFDRVIHNRADLEYLKGVVKMETELAKSHEFRVSDPPVDPAYRIDF